MEKPEQEDVCTGQPDCPCEACQILNARLDK